MARTDKRQAEPGFPEIGERLRAARAKIGMTRRQLSVGSGISERYLAVIESGTGNPSVSMLTALSDALDLAIPDLLPAGGERNAQHTALAAAMRRLSPDRLQALGEWLVHAEPPHVEKGRRIALVGLRGAGKTSLGKALAERIGLPFLEVSKEVERAYGGPLSLLIETSGQAALRRYENEAWEAIVREHEGAVIGAPGGIVAEGSLYGRLLDTAHSIWLRATPEDHMARVMAQGDFRPMASNRGAMTDLKAILDARTADYDRADARLDTSAQDFEETLDLLEDLARRLIVVRSERYVI